MSASVTVRDVSKVFAKQSENTTLMALDHVSLDVAPGEFVTLLGASGCGKSTLLRIIAGLETATLGEALCDGEVIRGTAPRRGLVFQEHTLFSWLTVQDNIAFALKATRQYRQRCPEIEQWIAVAGLGEFAHNYPHQLSGGMRQRAALVRALAVCPDVLLLDEPLGALDSLTRMTLQDELIRLWQERQTTMIMVTHDVDEAIYLSQRIVIMSPRPGRICKVLDVPMGYPRNRTSGDFTQLRAEILKLMDFAQDAHEDYAI